MRQGFQKGRKAAKLPAIPHELTSYLIEKLPHTTNMTLDEKIDLSSFTTEVNMMQI